MTDSLLWMWLSICISMKRKKENLAYGCAEMLPRWLVKRAAMRMIVHGTVEKFGTTDVTDVRAVTVLRRWNEPNV